MGIVGFKWGDKELTLLMNRDNWETRVIREANLVEGVYGSRCEETEGTWFGVTRGGRVAFLLDSALVSNFVGPEMIPIEFLKSNFTPERFAAELEKYEEENHLEYDEEDDETSGRTYELVVADITSGSMVYISKPSSDESTVIKKTVAFGVHTLSTEGLDSDKAKDLLLRNLFNTMIGEYENQELPELHELAARFMYNKTKADQGDELSALFVEKTANLGSSERVLERYGTTSTTAFVVDNTKKAKFYERYLENGMWKSNNFPFNIA